jgi:hypothetical protein
MYEKNSLICTALTAIVIVIPIQIVGASGNGGGEGYELRVRITEWPFGSDSVRVTIETACYLKHEKLEDLDFN